MPSQAPMFKPRFASRKPPKPKHNWGRKGTTTSRGYGYAWTKLRKKILERDEYLCIPCLRVDELKPATEVDHIINKASGGTDDESNLESICRECHKIKTAKENALY